MIRYKYVLAGKDEDFALWTGAFDTVELAEQWLSKWGEFHQERGHKLELIETTSNKE